MRSRYTAFTQANMEYIKKTMAGNALLDFNEIEARQWAKKVTWLRLEMIESIRHKDQPDRGEVEFIAWFIEKNQLHSLHERSQFHRIKNKWFYVTGHHPEEASKQKPVLIGRTSLCPCGSGKKFKNCHAR